MIQESNSGKHNVDYCQALLTRHMHRLLWACRPRPDLPNANRQAYCFPYLPKGRTLIHCFKKVVCVESLPGSSVAMSVRDCLD